MNTTFKQGDRVELIEDYTSRLPKGTQGTVAGDPYTLWEQGDPLVHVKYDTAPSDTNGTKISRLKLVVEAPKFKKGNRVQITIPAGNTDTYGGDYFVTGRGTVLEVDVDGGRTLLQVKADTAHPERDSHNNWWVDAKFVTPLQELPFEVGARVRSKAGYCGGDSEGIVTDLVPHIGGDITIAWDKGYALAGFTLGARRSGLEVIASPVVERPKATPATDTKPQIGDTIVAFWEQGGVETRKKGVIASFDYDGTAVTADGEYITHDPDGGEAAEDSVFIVERAPKPEPVKVDPNQKWIDAPVGSIATLSAFNFQWKKTAENEWTYFNAKTGRTFVDRDDTTINSGGDTLLLDI